MPGWDAARAAQDFDAFTADIDYGYDFDRMVIDWSSGQLLAAPQTLEVDAGHGWQNTSVSLSAGNRYAFTAAGRVDLGTATDERTGTVTPLESQADGISLEWYRGRPTGRLMLGQWIANPADGGRPHFEVLADGASGELVARVAGPLYVRLNGPPGKLSDRSGIMMITIRSVP
jgi:hypothetical protein